MKSGRRRAREYALQGLYQWLVAGGSPREIALQLAADPGFERADEAYFRVLLDGVVSHRDPLETLIGTAVDRKIETLSPIERAILMLGAYELQHRVEVPYRVVMNEAIELAKAYGGTDGHKYVNGVLDRLGPELRPEETRQ